MEQRHGQIMKYNNLLKCNIFPIYKGRLNLMSQSAAIPQMSTRC